MCQTYLFVVQINISSLAFVTFSGGILHKNEYMCETDSYKLTKNWKTNVVKIHLKNKKYDLLN